VWPGADDLFHDDSSPQSSRELCVRFIIVPGLDGSDHNHWQSTWESDWLSDATRIAPASWTKPDLDDWTTAIGSAIDLSDEPAVLITHSLGCLATAHWLTTVGSPTVRGAFLVAPPDQLAPTFPVDLLPSFIDLRATRLPVPALLVASDNDPYCTVEAATRLAAGWEVPLITTGSHGHLNSDSDLGLWPHGQQLVTSFLAGLGTGV
jgi:predicted alpha/beta hydrolase family esterase